MQTVPSLVGTGTAIAAAASGLVFGEALDSDDFFVPRPASYSTARPDTSDTRTYQRTSAPNSSRPGTSSAAPSIRVDAPQHHTLPHPPVVSRPPLSRYQRPKTSQFGSARLPSRRQSIIRQEDVQVNTIAETPRTSFSSTNSFLKRLSIRPSSQHDSPRSSVGLDSTSIAFSHGSGAPILSPRHSAAPPPTPNKLVKRTPSTSDEPTARPRAKSHLPTLRRPATSHQRSATLQSQADIDFGTPAGSSNNSIDQQLPQGLLPSAFEKPTTGRKSGWASFFHSRASSTGGRSVGRIADLNQGRSKRIAVFGQDHRQRAQLIKPSMVSDAVQSAPTVSVPADIREEKTEEAHSSSEETPRRTRRSISMTFATAGDWVSRTSGSIRRPKRGSTPKSGTPRHVSDPVSTPGSIAERRANATPRVATAPNPLATPQGSALALTTNSRSDAQTQARRRNTSSPLPPLSGVSSFHADFSRSGLSGGAAIQNLRQNQPSGSSTSSTAMSQLRTRHHERTSTVDGSESEQRGFTSGDDEDTDFKSDTMFDSLRTGASGHVRTVETPLESMYDESPPSTAGNGKAKRLSIQEILGGDWEAGGKILEEDETMQTPVRSNSKRLQEPRFSTESGFSSREYGRFSVDDDFDDDWARDDEDGPLNALSAPSKGSSLNSRGVHPNIRQALASVSGNSMAETDTRTERPLSNLFDWSEPSLPDKNEPNGRSLRPKTAYANQEADARGGRSAIRKGPTPTHVRSQSVPVVNENQDETKPTGAKYGTWGLGTKTISEDWDDDFEFGGGVEDEKAKESIFAVPESIQAAQPSVKAHSGQIRELSLLVNDLQRLCRHGKDYELLDGPQRTLWKEAEGIIALASPEDDDLEADHETSSSIDLDAFEANDRLFDDDYDSTTLDKLDAALDGHEPVMSKTAVVRDRPSPRRRSVMSPDDDIFGNHWPLTEENLQSRSSRPRTPEPRLNKATDVNGMVRSVVEVMQHRSITESLLEGGNANKKMHFDTNSLKTLVKRASDLRDILSDAVRRAEQLTQSPARTPRHERQLESSPAFVKVFDDPGSSPPRRVTRSRGNTVKVDSPENSPSSGINRRLQLMTVK